MTMILRFLIVVAVLTAVWCGVLWFALPEQWLHDLLRKGSLISLVAAHVGPPLFVVTAWKTCKWAWGWRAEKRAEAKKIAEQQAAEEAARVARQKEHEQRRAHVECRAAWAVLPEIPDWFEDKSAQCALESLDARKIQGAGREAALTLSLQRVFEMVWSKCETLPFLPVMLVTDNPLQKQWAEKAWQQVLEAMDFEDLPSRPEFEILTGSGSIPDRVIALFETNPDLPAVLLVGMDSPLAEADDSEEPSHPKPPKPGHAVVALLLSRSGLAIPEGARQPEPEREVNALTPFWERETGHVPDSPGWARVPPLLRPAFLQKHPPIAAVHRMSAITPPEKSSRALLRRLAYEAIQDVLISVGLRDLPIKDGESGQKTSQATSEDDSAPFPGWLVHNVPLIRLAPLYDSMLDHGYELELVSESSNIEEEYGNTGAAGGTLMLAESLIRAVQLQQPVMVAEFEGINRFALGVSRPAAYNA